MAAREKISLEDFKRFVHQADRLFELIKGELVEVTPGRSSNSQIHDVIVAAVRPFCTANQIPCYTCSADGAYQTGNNVGASQFAYKRTPMSDCEPGPVPSMHGV